MPISTKVQARPPRDQRLVFRSGDLRAGGLVARGLLYALPHRHNSTYDWNKKQLDGSTVTDRSDDLPHHERTLSPRSYPDEGRKEIFYLTTHSTHFIYVYMASPIW